MMIVQNFSEFRDVKVNLSHDLILSNIKNKSVLGTISTILILKVTLNKSRYSLYMNLKIVLLIFVVTLSSGITNDSYWQS